MGLRRVLGVLVGLSAIWVAMPAVAAGANAAGHGLLVVQPRTGGGLVLVAPDGSAARRICTDRSVCGVPRDPVWSPTGRLIAYKTGRALDVIYPDGTCLDCGLTPDPYGTWTFKRIGFRPDGSLGFDGSEVSTEVGDHRAIFSVAVDGLGLAAVLRAGYRSPAWSRGGRLAVVRAGAIFVTSAAAGRLRRVTKHGGLPAWSPDGRKLAVVDRGRVEVISLRGRVIRVLGAGTAPTWSANGRQIAFVAGGGKIMIAPVGHGRAHAVPGVTGVRVSWQPVASSVPSCDDAPAGSDIVASAAGVVVTSRSEAAETEDSAVTYLGCLRSTGEERTLYSYTGIGNASGSAQDFALAGDYVAFNTLVSDQYGFIQDVITSDLRTGQAVYDDPLDQVPGCPTFGVGGGLGYPCPYLTALALSAAGSPVWEANLTSLDGQTQTETIVADEHTGIVTLDTETVAVDATSPSVGLAHLQVVGNQAVWTHDGQARSATLNN